jgi:hypothetical protein
MTVERWAISRHEETGFYGEYASRDESIKAGLAEYGRDTFYIVKARPPAPLSSGIDAESLIEDLIEGPLEEEWFIEQAESWKPTPEQYKDLESRLKRCLDQWVEESGLEPTWFICDDIERIGD